MNRTPHYTARAILVLLLTSPLEASEWSLTIDRNGIQVYVRDYPGSSVDQFRGETVFASSMDSVIAVLDDASICDKWLHRCVQAREIERMSFNERFIYQINSVHTLASTRDLIIHTKVQRNVTEGSIIIESTAVPDYCKNRNTEPCRTINRSDYVRVTKLVSRWRLLPIEGAKIRVIWEQHIEPAGYLLDFVVNQLLDDVPYNTLNNLRRLASTAPFDRAILLFDAQGQIRGIAHP